MSAILHMHMASSMAATLNTSGLDLHPRLIQNSNHPWENANFQRVHSTEKSCPTYRARLSPSCHSSPNIAAYRYERVETRIEGADPFPL